MSDLHTSLSIYDYSDDLRAEKQRLAHLYHVGDRQLWRAYRFAQRQPGDPAVNLLGNLERRLETVITRAGFAPDVWSAREIVAHHHVTVDGRCVSVPSYRVQIGQVIQVRPRKVQPLMLLQYKEGLPDTPPYIRADYASLTVRLTRAPRREEIPCDVDESLINQYYLLM